ncbi:hypothetical protein ASF45_27925 [Pseudorhodoferax sp. Leaf265]|nr:hypothetical protein ASF45_27925 [Pseudorhodoferax sp. Leaf265]
MSTQLMLESRHNELPLAVLSEADPDVLAYFAQPQTLRLSIRDSSGRVKSTQNYTPDLLAIKKKRVIVYEARDLVALAEASAKNSFQFYLEDGRWHYRAAEEAFAAMGIEHVIVASNQIPAAVVRNLQFLENFTSEDCPELDPEVGENIAALVLQHRTIEFDKLLAAGFSSDDVFKAIVGKYVYVDLTTQLVDQTRDLVVFSDRPTYEAHRRIEVADLEKPLPVPGRAWIRAGGQLTFDGVDYTVVLVGERDVVMRQNGQAETTTMPLEALKLLFEAGKVQTDALTAKSDVKQLADYSQDEIDRALDRLKALDDPENSAYSPRQLAHFRTLIAHADNQLDALIALIDKCSQRGNFTPRHSERSVELMHEAIDDFYNDKTKPTKKAAFLVYLAKCDDAMNAGEPAFTTISYKRFCEVCTEREDVVAREGKKAGYQASRIVGSLDNSAPVHGVRPFEVVHIDHTIATLATVSPNGVSLGKPTLTIAIDACTTQVRGVISSYDPPSAKTVLLILRDIIRRYGRVMRVLVLDNGKEFHSFELTFFCKLFGIEIRYRSPGQPRGGSLVERAFGAIETELIAQLEGNTRQMRDPRLVTKEVNPFNNPVWTLPAFHRATEHFLFVVKPNQVAPALGMAPLQYEEEMLKRTGERVHMFVKFDENVMLLTSPHASRRMHVVCPRRGVWCNGLWYQHPEFKKLKRKSKAEVRVEPWLHRLIYVHINGRWVGATACNARWLGNKTRREVEIALREERKKAGTTANADSLTLRRAKALVEVIEPSNFDPRLRIQQLEMQHLFGAMGMTVAMPQAAPDTIDVVTAEVPTSSGTATTVEPAEPQPQAPPVALALPAATATVRPATPVLDSAASPTFGKDDEFAALDIPGFH